ncbi:hypothetical protein JTB14_020371 [Gonioctena quinquepunctata]|nr:hypothetical protein JTB14_020371 [Gonioctena quinquepunctata]
MFQVDVYTGEKLSYKRILEESCNLAEALRSFGSGPDSIHAVCSENNINFFIPIFASLFVGSTTVPINPSYVTDELQHVLKLTTPSIVFCSQAVKDKFLKYSQNRPGVSDGISIKKIIVINSNTDFPGTITMGHFISEHTRGNPVMPTKFQPYNDRDPTQHVAFIMSSSGTTGMPKGVMLPHRALAVRLAQSR